MSDLISDYFFYSLVIVALLAIVYGGICLILRPLVLWYFKIYTLASELRENNALLREIRDELMTRNIQTPSSRQPKEDYSKPKEDYSKYMPR